MLVARIIVTILTPRRRLPSPTPKPRLKLCAGWNRPLANLSQLFARQVVGTKEVHDEIWQVSFMDYDFLWIMT